jgi:hypothetical protein
MKQSKIKRLISKKLANQIAQADERTRLELTALVEQEASPIIQKMKAKGYHLISRLDNGEGVFVREDNVVGLHIQLPSDLYRKLDEECRKREITKRNLVIAALEQYLQ